MKIQVLVRSADWLQSAGTRIRYRRIQQVFARLGGTFAIDPIASIREGLRLNADVYLFSKCQDAGALMLADMLREAGRLVGFDLFDDYMSGRENSTLGQRVFYRSLIGHVDFMLCSTRRMAEVVAEFNHSVPVHVLNDPHDSVSIVECRRALAGKFAAGRDSSRVNVLWFGQGSNPNFPVGLSDLVGFGDHLHSLKASGREVHLKILTNPDAIDANGLQSLRSLPVPFSLEEWSEQREARELDRAHVAFLPVNYQKFSIAKSLNRAVTALVRGVQVLSPGFPLYAPLDAFIYDSGAKLAHDLSSGALRLGPGSLESLSETLSEIADPAKEAAELQAFLGRLLAGTAHRPVAARFPRAILHGASSTPAIHSLCRAMGWLSLGSPFTRHNLPYHARVGCFEPDCPVELRVSREGLARMPEALRGAAVELGRNNESTFSHAMPLPEGPAGDLLRAARPIMWQTRSARIVSYKPLMEATRSVFAGLFANTLFVTSELEMPLAVAEAELVPST